MYTLEISLPYCQRDRRLNHAGLGSINGFGVYTVDMENSTFCINAITNYSPS